MSEKKQYPIITLGGGCFWCTEGVFLHVRGVKQVIPGYAGGTTQNPTYTAVTTGQTGHAEVVQITYDPGIVTYQELLEIFWNTHDPTTPNRQGADRGTQYRSILLYNTEEEKKTAEAYIHQLKDKNTFPKPIVTEISPLRHFYRAEPEHINYYLSNPQKQYCQYVIRPKVEKFKNQFAKKTRPQAQS